MIFHRREGTYYKEEKSTSLFFLYQNFFGRCLLKILTRKSISAFGGAYMNSRFSKRRIPKFISKNKIDMEEYEKQEYRCFNDFFTRKIKREKRPYKDDPSLFLAPADSKLLVYSIDSETGFWIKNSYYTVGELLKNEELAKKYQGGYCFIYRLGVEDYHRYSYIDDGKVIDRKKIPGIFHTVQPIASKRYKVFSENTREYQVLKTKNFGTIVQMEVGALMVGKICNWECHQFQRGQEKGYFCFGGSTIVVLVEKNTIIPDADILENSSKNIESRVYLFESVGRRMK